MKKAVFFDIDGTLWNEHMQIAKSTVDAICRLRENGHLAFICSGRSRSNIRSERLLGIGFDGLIAGCGVYIEYDGEVAYEKRLSEETVRRAVGVFRKYRMEALLEGPRYSYADGADFADDPYVRYLRKELGEDLKEISECETLEVNKFSAVVNSEDLPAIRRELGAEFDVVMHNEELIEILPAGHSKATGIERVCTALGIAREDTYAFGDSANDLEMLSYVGHGIAMGNATAPVKAAAEYVTAPVDDGGIWQGLRHYGLI